MRFRIWNDRGMLVRTDPLGFIGGGLAGIVLSDVVIKAIDHYSRLDILVKLSTHFEWLLGPEMLASIVICGFLALYFATRSELDRIIRHFRLGARGDITVELFRWKALKSGGVSAGISMLSCILAALAFTVIPLIKAPPHTPLRKAEVDVVTRQIKETVAHISIAKPNVYRAPATAQPSLKVGTVALQAGAVASFGQQGGQTASTIINNRPPLPQLRFTEEVKMPLRPDGNGEELLTVHIFTDRMINGATIGIIMSGPVTIAGDNPNNGGPILLGAPVTSLAAGMPLLQGPDKSPVPNSLFVSIAIPAALGSTQELLVLVRAKTNVHVLRVLSLEN